MPAFVFEDFVSGSVTIYGHQTLSSDDIVTFAREYDAQPMHTDPEAARHTFVGQMIASGWHTCAVTMRMFYDNILAGSTSMGSPGVEEGTWVKPVLPGDTLRVRQTIGETRPSRSRPEVGLVNFIFDVLDQRDEIVYKQSCWVMFGRRGAEGWDKPRDATPTAVLPPPAQDGATEDRLALWFDDIVIGDIANIGSHPFTPEYIIDYAKDFDPQPFHTDIEAARQSQFGGLCASGWQTGAVWMKLMISYQVKQAYRAAKAGLPMGRLGPSPGFRNMRWLRPVYAGNVLTYRTQIIDTRATASRPQWGVVSTLNTAENEKGEPVFSFEGAVFWERRGDNR